MLAIRLLAGATVALAVLAVASGSTGRPAPTAASAAGSVRVFITFGPDFDRDGDWRDAAQEQPLQTRMLLDLGGTRLRRFRLTQAVAAEVSPDALATLRNDPRVARIESDGQVTATDAELDSSWGVKRIGAGLAHDAGLQGAGVKVGIIDTGINRTHVDLDGNYSAACSYDFANNDSDPMDDHGHGSHVSGIVAAEDNNSGVVGVAPKVTLCAYKVLGADGGGSWSSVISALDRAVSDGVRVVNLSLGSSDYPGQSVEDAFTAANNAGLVIVAAAGNAGVCQGTGDTVLYPARFAAVIAVAATDSSDITPCFSSTGPKVELAAPGVAVQSTWAGGSSTYVSASGTSMASPHAAGVAALVISCKPSLTSAQVRTILDTTAKDLDNPLVAGTHDGRDIWYGYGLVQAQAAVAAAGLCVNATPTPPASTPTPTRTPTPGAPQPTPMPTAAPSFRRNPDCPSDWNSDGAVNMLDIVLVSSLYGTNGISLPDILTVGQAYGTTCPAG